MTDAQIRHMVDRFLSWRLPENFSPDAGISFKPSFNEDTPYPMKHEPVGTNLFDASQAEAMVRSMVERMPVDDQTTRIKALELGLSPFAGAQLLSYSPIMCNDVQLGSCYVTCIIGGFPDQLPKTFDAARSLLDPGVKS